MQHAAGEHQATAGGTIAFNAVLAGSIVLSLDGALPVEYLCPGDRIVTRDSGTAVLRASRIGMCAEPAVRIAGGTLGPGRPSRDVILPARAEVLLRDDHALALCGRARALVQAANMIDGKHVRDIGRRAMPLVQLIFDTPHIIYADGLEVASTPMVRTQATETRAAAHPGYPRQ